MKCPRCKAAPKRPGDSYCQPCRRAKTREWREANRERDRELATLYRRRRGVGPRRLLPAQGHIRLSLKQIRAILTHDA